MCLSAPTYPLATTIRGIRLEFEPSAAMAEVSDTLELARLAVESLYGSERLEVEAQWEVDAAGRKIAIDTTTEAGRALGIVFLGYVKREFGADAVRVARVTAASDQGEARR